MSVGAALAIAVCCDRGLHGEYGIHVHALLNGLVSVKLGVGRR